MTLVSEGARVQRAEREVAGWGKDEPPPSAHRPCMTLDEHQAWVAANLMLGQRAASPCQDCTRAFAAEMRAIGRCDGVPGNTGGRIIEPATDPRVIRRRAQYRAAQQRKRDRARAA